MCFQKKAHFLGIKQSTSVWVQTQKNVFFAANFLLFCRKNAENDYFDQRLECAAPKRWSIYTTNLGERERDISDNGMDTSWCWQSIVSLMRTFEWLQFTVSNGTRKTGAINWFAKLKACFPSYQGESTIFDKWNFLSQTPDTKNI